MWPRPMAPVPLTLPLSHEGRGNVRCGWVYCLGLVDLKNQMPLCDWWAVLDPWTGLFEGGGGG